MSLLNVACPDSSLRAEAPIDFKTAYAALKRRPSTVAHDFATFSAAGEACLSNHLMSLLDVACPDSSLRAEALIDFKTAYAALKRRSSTVASTSMYWGKA